MRVLMVSTDISILESGSPSQNRMVEYGSLAEKLFIVVLSKKRINSQMLAISPNTKVYPAYFWGAWHIGKIFEKEGINLVTAQDPFETGLIAYRAVRRLGAKLQLQIHTDFLSPYFAKESFKNRIRVRLAKWLLPKADGIRVVSERIKKSLSVIKGQLSKVIVLPIFVDVEKIESEPITVDLHKKHPQFDVILLMASRLTCEKNIGLTISALSEVVKINSTVGLVIVGDGPAKGDLLRKVCDLGLTSNVIFESRTENISSYYKTADIFLNTSNYEGYGRTLIEAASAGLPIITTDVGVVGEVFNPQNCLIIPVGGGKALIQSIVRLLGDKPLRQVLIHKAAHVVRRLSDRDFYLQQYKQSWEVAL